MASNQFIHLYDRHQSSQCNCRAGRLFSSSSEDLAAIT